MTDIGVFTQTFQAENLSWDLTPDPDSEFRDGGTLDVTTFTQAQHFPNGYIPSGTVLGVVTATGKLGPYLGSATDGRQTAVGILARTIQVVQLNGVLKTNVGCPVLKAFGVVSQAKLPLTSANAAAGGYLDAAAHTALPLIYFAA